MMSLIIPLHQIRDEDRGRVGGKAFVLATLARLGMDVPDALCVTGVPDATRLIRTGDSITVDGYLGIVIVE